MRPIRHAKALVRERVTTLVRSQVRAEMKATATLAAQVVEARQADASRLNSTYDHTKHPDDDFYRALARRLRACGIEVREQAIDETSFRAWMDDQPQMRQRYSDPTVGLEKLLEHFLAFEATHPTPGHTYVDVAAQSSCWASCLRQLHVKAYSLDLVYRPGVRGWRIGADAQAVPLPSESVDAMSAHCAFECFQGDADVGFIREAARLLRNGGRLAIVPLYVDDAHFIATSPYTVVDPGSFDEDATVVWRDDEYDAPFSRHYSPEALVDRLGDALGLFSEVRVVHITNLESLRERWPESRLYAYFVLECRK